jgi:hypothetical protein
MSTSVYFVNFYLLFESNVSIYYLLFVCSYILVWRNLACQQ